MKSMLTGARRTRKRATARVAAVLLVALLAPTFGAMSAQAQSAPCANTPSITWVGSATSEPDSWHTAGNWDAGRVPAAGDQVCIPDVADTSAVTFSSGTTSVASVES